MKQVFKLTILNDSTPELIMNGKFSASKPGIGCNHCFSRLLLLESLIIFVVFQSSTIIKSVGCRCSNSLFGAYSKI